jgi:hypothetical protein
MRSGTGKQVDEYLSSHYSAMSSKNRRSAPESDSPPEAWQNGLLHALSNSPEKSPEAATANYSPETAAPQSSDEARLRLHHVNRYENCPAGARTTAHQRLDTDAPLQHRLLTPESQWQPRGNRRISQGWVRTGNVHSDVARLQAQAEAAAYAAEEAALAAQVTDHPTSTRQPSQYTLYGDDCRLQRAEEAAARVAHAARLARSGSQKERAEAARAAAVAEAEAAALSAAHAVASSSFSRRDVRCVAASSDDVIHGVHSQPRLLPGETVEWEMEDADIPAGSVGTVSRRGPSDCPEMPHVVVFFNSGESCIYPVNPCSVWSF